MPSLSLFPIVVLALTSASLAAAAQEAPHETSPPQTQEVKGPPNADAAQKRGISEEGGMKASGPSQGKDGESR